MLRILLSPDGGAGGATTTLRERTAPAKRAARAKALPKESRGEEILHELFRKVGTDLRGDKHASQLIKELAGELGWKGKSDAESN